MISDVKIYHFKSIEGAAIRLDNITLFVGNNGSGKTNIVDSIRFIRDATQHGLDRAFSDRHGVGSVRQWSPTRPYLITLSVHFTEERLSFTYNVSIGTRGDEFFVLKEELDLKQVDNLMFVGDDEEEFSGSELEWIIARREKDQIQISRRTIPLGEGEDPPEDLENSIIWANSLPSTEEFQVAPEDILFASRSWQVALARQRLASFQAYSIFPNTLRLPQEPSNETYLTSEGRNLASVFKRMRRNKRGQDAIVQITDGMRAVIPHLERISVLSVGGYLVPQFHIVESDGKKHIFNVSQMSDGTLRMLGLLTALYQEPRPLVIALEEPEQTINPGLLPIIADAIREVSRTVQIIVTTHSPHLLDQFKAEQVRSVELEGGKTQVAPISEVQMSVVRDKLFTLGELLVNEGLHG